MSKRLLGAVVWMVVLAVGGSAWGVTLFTDDFNRDDARTLGSNWDETQGDQEWGISGNVALISWDRGHRNGRALAVLDGLVDASEGFEITLKTESVFKEGQQDQFSGVLFAYQNPDNYWEFETRNHSSHVSPTLLWQIEIWEVADGVRTQRGPTVEPETLGWHDLSVSYDGANLTATGDGFSVGPLAVSLPDGGVGLFSRAVDLIWHWDDYNLEGTLAEVSQDTPGDADRNGVVDDADLSLLLANWNLDTTGDPDGGWGRGEFDGTPPVEDADLSLLLSNWTAAGAVPEPASAMILLLGLGGSALRRGKK